MLLIIVQLGRRAPDWRGSLKRILSYFSRAGGELAEPGLVLLPENWLSREPVSLEDYTWAVERLGEETGHRIAGGVQYVLEGGGVKSVGIAYLGRGVERYCEKIHPSRAVGERERVSPGRLVEPVDLGGFKLGCIACVDVFYPEISRALTVLGSQVLYNPSNIPEDRIYLWHSALLSRAAENTVYAVGVNAPGNVYPDNRVTGGESSVFTPHGRHLVNLGGEERVAQVRVDLKLIDEARRRWAFHDDLARFYATFYLKMFGLDTRPVYHRNL